MNTFVLIGAEFQDINGKPFGQITKISLEQLCSSGDSKITASRQVLTDLIEHQISEAQAAASVSEQEK
jgi:uncharacterized protein YegL